MDLGDLYRRWLFDVWLGDFAAAEEIFAADFVGHWPGFDAHGPEGAVEQVKKSREMFDDIANTLDVGPIVDGDLVAARWTFNGAYRQGVPGATVPPGTGIAFTGQDIFRAENGRFAEYWVVSDALGLMTALGVYGS